MPDGSHASPTSPRRIRPRSPRFDWAALPREWFGGDLVASHVVDALNLLFPEGERFFFRSVRRYLDRIDDDVLRDQVRAFFQQEGRHGAAHEHQAEALRAQGYDVDAFLRLYVKLGYRVIEPLTPAAVRLATTAALEHYTAILAHAALTDGLLDLAHPEMARLLKWHACEEIEHKAVAFDVLRKVAPGYGVRMAGLAIGTTTLVGFLAVALAHLLVQDARAGRLTGAARPLRAHRGNLASVLVRGFRAYVMPGFHPSQRDDWEIARRWLEQAGLEAA